MKLNLSDSARDIMLRHAESCYPNECCGFFFGREEGGERLIEQARQVDNAKEGDQRRRFRIDTDDYRKAEAYTAENGLDLLGIYHSHPGHPAIPSEHDRKVAMPFFSYIIISVVEGEAVDIRSWQLNADRQFDEEPIVQTGQLKKTKQDS